MTSQFLRLLQQQVRSELHRQFGGSSTRLALAIIEVARFAMIALVILMIVGGLATGSWLSVFVACGAVAVSRMGR